MLRLALHRLVLLAVDVTFEGPGKNGHGLGTREREEVYFQPLGFESKRDKENGGSPLAKCPAGSYLKTGLRVASLL